MHVALAQARARLGRFVAERRSGRLAWKLIIEKQRRRPAARK